MIKELTQPILQIIGTTVIGVLTLVLLSLNKKIVNWFLTNIWTKISNPDEHGKLKQSEIDKNIKIREILIELRTIVKAERTCLFKFHNGNTFSTKEPIWKVSSTHESVAPGIASVIGQLQDIKASSIIETLQALWPGNNKLPSGVEIISPEYCKQCLPRCKKDGKRIVFIDVQKLEDGYSRSLLVEQGITYVIDVPVHNGENNIVGFVTVNYCGKKDVEEIKNYAHDICRNTSQIQFLLLN